MSGFSKVINLGTFGTLTLSEAAGNVSLAFSMDISAGGGLTAGVVTVVESLAIQGKGAQAVDAGFVLAEKKWPTVAPALMIARPLVDAFLAGI